MSEQLAGMNDNYDVLVIGGGITGAGVAREAAAAGLKTLLVEQKDYAWGTSSRSSKMVHGGLRYLASGHVRLTRDAVRERERMLREAPGLVDRLRYILPHYQKAFPGPRLFSLFLRAYDFFARETYRHRISSEELRQWVPGLETERLIGATGFSDAVTEDARLVMRVLAEARALGADLRNYVKADEVSALPDRRWQVTLTDKSGQPECAAANETAGSRKVTAKLVVNATGVWADRLWQSAKGKEQIRPLRGSHVVVPFHKLPVSASLMLQHPDDGRTVFIYPWLGCTILGTTDLDHKGELDLEPVISLDELDYLFRLAARTFPGCHLSEQDVISTWSGIRPVVSSGKARSPSQESREHVIWNEQGLVSVAGGKLTTFRLIAREVLTAGADCLEGLTLVADEQPVFRQAEDLHCPPQIRAQTWRRLQGYYGPDLSDLIHSGPLAEVPGTDLLWAELHWIARNESVIHLDDLLLRRTRLGLVLPEGAKHLLEELEKALGPDLRWSADRWQTEKERYLSIWRSAYYLPEKAARAGIR